MSYKVLIVEDDPMVAMINEQYVQKNNDFTVCSCVKTGADALSYLEKNEVDLIILDVFMPIMNGVEVLKKIRQNKFNTDVIMVTAANDSTTIEQTMNLGVIDYLIKPFALERFLVALQKFSLKRQTLKNAQTLDQSSLDKLIATSQNDFTQLQNSAAQKTEYPKGIQEKTLLLITEYLEQKCKTEYIDGEQISKEVGLSSVTIRHYMNYLVECKKVSQTINYETGGRPSVLYKSLL